MDLFQYAVVNKLRFPYTRGPVSVEVSVEDLFDLNLKGLNEIYQTLIKARKEMVEESLEKSHDEEKAERLNIMIDLVVYIYNQKVEAQKEKEKKAENARKKKYLMEVLARKEDEGLNSKSVDELRAMINEL